jgi:hypothetical protein
MTNHCVILLKEAEARTSSRKKRGLGFSARPLKSIIPGRSVSRPIVSRDHLRRHARFQSLRLNEQLLISIPGHVSDVPHLADDVR